MAARKEHSKLATALAVGAAAALGISLLHASGAPELLELKTRDLRMKWTLPAESARDDNGVPITGHPEVGLIMITEDSVQWLQKESKKPWPWPREAFGFLIKGCAIGKSKAVLFDLFTHVDRDVHGTEKVMAEAMKAGPPVYLAVPFRNESIPTADLREDLEDLLRRFEVKIDTDGSVDVADEYRSVLLPHSLIAPAAAGVCDVSTPRDRDGVLRRYRLFSKFRGRWYPSMALAGIMAREGVGEVRVRDRVLTVGRLVIPLAEDGTIGLRYYEPFGKLPASRVMSGVWDLQDQGKTDQFDPKRLENRLVVLGTDAAMLYDLKVTPVRENMAGSEVHATALKNFLAGEYLRTAPSGCSYLLIAALALAVALITRFSSAAVGGAGAAAVLAAVIGADVALFRARWVVDLVSPVAVVVLTYAATSAVNFLYEGRQRLRTKREFQRYFSPLVVEKILKNPDALSLAGERKVLSIFFMDFQGFTSMSEKLDPAELVKLISEYHNEAAEEIFRTEGTVDKYIGDAIMAFWNDPLEQPDHALRACLSAVGAQRRLKEMAAQMKERGLPEMRARIGINSGVATVGNMGARRQVNYTAIGDEVNLASRLEGVNKEFGTDIIVSEATFQPARDRLEARELAYIKVKGRKHPVRIFELLGLRGEVAPAGLEAARRFEEVLAKFRARQFEKALEGFRALAAQGDAASEAYADLCERYRQEPPPADWDGWYQMETK